MALRGFFLVAAAIGFALAAEACAICGLNESFSPKMLFISLGFVGLPLGFAGFIGWLVWRDSQDSDSSRGS